MVPVSCSDFTVLASRFPGQVLRHEFRRRAPPGHVGMNCNWRLRGTWAGTSTGPNGVCGANSNRHKGHADGNCNGCQGSIRDQNSKACKRSIQGGVEMETNVSYGHEFQG